MDTEFWGTIKYFKPKEFSYPDNVSRELIRALDRYRVLVGKPIIIHSDYRPKDDGSQHALGLAVDFHVKGMSVIDQYLLAEKSNLFTGIGVYPDWNNPGLHCDIRVVKGNDFPARWGRWGEKDYVALNEDFFRKVLAK